MRLARWTIAVASGAWFAAFAALMGRWSAQPALGWGLAAAALALGAAGGALGAAPDEDGVRAWSVVGAIAALAAPALLHAIGLSFADPSLLRRPLGGGGFAVFVLGQAAFIAAFAAAAWTRAARGAGAAAPAVAVAAVSGIVCAAWAARLFDAGAFAAAWALLVLAVAVVGERPWTRRASAPLRARAFAAAALAGLGLALFAPGLLLDVWLARLYAAYPGGKFLAAADDGTDLWAAFRYSNGSGLLLRDGVPQNHDSASASLALKVLIAQTPSGGAPPFVLLVRPSDPMVAFAAKGDGAAVAIDDGTPARAAALTALGLGPDWRSLLPATPPGRKPTSALLFTALPPGADHGGEADGRSLRALRARLADGAVAGILLPADAPGPSVDAAARAAAAVFGGARVADLPQGVLIVAAPAAIETDAGVLLDRLPTSTQIAEIGRKTTLAKDVRWRAAPSTK